MKKQIFPPANHEGKLAENAKDILVSGTGSIPAVGGLVAGVLEKIFPSGLERRREVWEVAVSDALNGFNAEELATNEEFLTLLIRSTEAARRTHNFSKIERLSYALVNHASDLEFEMKSKFVQWIDAFSTRDLAVLTRISNDEAVMYDDLVRDIFSGRADILRVTMEDIQTTKRMIVTPRTDESGVLRLTEIGEGFCRYVGIRH